MDQLSFIQPESYENFAFGLQSSYGVCSYCWVDFEQDDEVVEWQCRRVHESCQTQLMKAYNPMEYARAVLCLVNSRYGSDNDRFKLWAFMNVFHPTYGEQETRRFVNEVYSR